MPYICHRQRNDIRMDNAWLGRGVQDTDTQHHEEEVEVAELEGEDVLGWQERVSRVELVGV